jgi:hypothetical protein
MRIRLIYFGATAFAVSGCLLFAACAVWAAHHGKMMPTIVYGVFAAGGVWVAWKMIGAFWEIRKKYVISSGRISCLTGRESKSVVLSDVKSMISDAREGYVSLRASSEEELLRIQIDNPIVPELKAYFENPGSG